MLGTFDFTTLRFVPRDFYDQMSREKIQREDILIVKDGATTGKVTFIDEQFPFAEAAVNEHVFLCRPKTNVIVPRFLFFWLYSPDGQRAIRMNYQGSAIGGINQDFADSLWVPYPPMPEQQRIVEILSERMISIGKLRKAAQQQQVVAKQLRFSIISQYMDSYSFSNGHLIDVLSSPPATGWPHAYGNKRKGTPFLTLSAVLDFEYDGSQVKYTDLPVDKRADYWARRGDILMSRSNTPDLVGHAAIYDGTPEEVIFPDLLIRLSVNDKRADIRFTHYWLMSPTVRRYIYSNARGSSGTMKKITLEMVRKIPFPLHLRLEEQVQIANAIEQKVEKAKTIRYAAERQLNAINALPNVLLREIFGFEPPSDME